MARASSVHRSRPSLGLAAPQVNLAKGTITIGWAALRADIHFALPSRLLTNNAHGMRAAANDESQPSVVGSDQQVEDRSA